MPMPKVLPHVQIGGFQADYLGQEDEEDEDDVHGAQDTIHVPEVPVKEASRNMAEPRVLRCEGTTI